MKSEIIEFESLKFVGLKTLIRSSLNAPKDMRQVPALWPKLAQLASVIPNRIGTDRFALITGDLPMNLQNEAYYYALYQVKSFNNVPESVITCEIQKGKLAKFVHQGPPEKIGETAMKILTQWLPNSDETLFDNLELFIYSAHYDRLDPKSEFEYGLFLK